MNRHDESSWTAARLLGRLRSALFGVADENKDVESTHRRCRDGLNIVLAGLRFQAGRPSSACRPPITGGRWRLQNRRRHATTAGFRRTKPACGLAHGFDYNDVSWGV
jgi:hypothetical protein